jgi:predicted FMN-binding regulatory protein PaiB
LFVHAKSATKFAIPSETSMYIPDRFKEERIHVLHDAIRRAALATLVSMTADGLIASHIPLLLDPQPAPYGSLLGHLARPNPQVRIPGEVARHSGMISPTIPI